MKRITLAAAGAVLVLLAPCNAHAQSLDDATAAALANSPVLSAADARVDGADARLTQARSARYPQITARGQYAEAETDFGGGRQDINPRSGMVSAEQLLFAGGRVWASVRQARAGREASEAERDGMRAALIADVAEAYLGLTTSRRALALRTSTLASLTTLADQSQARFDAGEIARSELAQALARRAGAQAALAQARADEASAVARFRRVIGVEPGVLAPVDAAPETPPTREDAIARAQRASAQLIALREAETAASAGIWRAASQHAPTVSLSVEASSVRDEFLPGYRADGTAFIARASIPLFTVTDDVTSAFENNQAAREAEAAARLQVEASRTALQSMRDEASVGQRPTIDVLDAERDLLQAELDLDHARATLVVSAYRLRALAGMT